MGYLDPDVLRDEVGAADAVLTELAQRLPEWEAHEGSVETSLAEAVGVVAATIAELLADEARSVYEGFAWNILGLQRQPAAPSAASATFTMSDTSGRTIPAGTLVTVKAADGSPVTFGTVGDWMADTGQVSLPGVPVTSLDAGAETNGISGDAFLETGVPGVASATIPTPSSGGADEEDQAAFLDRVAVRARMLRVLPITAGDYASLALDHPSVARALAVNLLDASSPPVWPAAPAAGGHVTVYVIDQAGLALSSTSMLEVKALLEAPGRVSNVVVHVAAPAYVAIDVAMSVWPSHGFTPSDAQAAAVLAAQTYLSPAMWAYDAAAPGLWSLPALASEREVTAIGVAHHVAQQPAVGGVATCTVGGGASVPLAGYAVLPTVGTVTATAAT